MKMVLMGKKEGGGTKVVLPYSVERTVQATNLHLERKLPVLFTAFYERGNMLGSDKKTAQIQGIMHDKEVQAASWPPLQDPAGPPAD